MSDRSRFYGMIGVGALAIIALASVVYFRSGEKAPVDEKPAKKSSGKVSKKSSSKEASSAPVVSSGEKASTAPVSSEQPAPSPTAAAVVEDVEEDDDVEEQARLRKSYDHTLKRAKQFLQGEKFSHAASLFSEAIDMADKIPSAAKDLTALYNNRSAMYEKSGQFEDSLKDITVVLATDGKHLKARSRRARIMEKQGKFDEALRDLVFCSIVEGAQGIASSSATKASELCKKISVPEVVAVVDRIRNSSGRSLPNKGYCRNYFESFMSYQQWKAECKDVDRDELVRRSYHELHTSSPVEGAKMELQDILTLIKVDLVNLDFKKAFAHIPRGKHLLASDQLVNDNAATTVATRSLLEDLMGVEKHLRCDLTGALGHYSAAIKAINCGGVAALIETSVGLEAGCTISETGDIKDQVEAVELFLKLASAYLELGENDKAAELYKAVLTSTQDATSKTLAAMHPWVLVHQVALHITKDELGCYRPNGVENAVQDLELVLELTADVAKRDQVALQCRVGGLLKLVHVISQTKVAVGQTPSDEEMAKVSSYIQEAKRLSPLNENVIMLDADLLSINGETDAALARCDEVILLSDKSDSVPYVIKANVMMQKAMMQMQYAQNTRSEQAMYEAQATMAEVDKIFSEAINIEPNGLEAFAQYAQLKSMMGELDPALEYLEKALTNSRSKDEVQELCVMKVNIVAQKHAIDEYKSL